MSMRTAICVMVKNEARDILEWLAFHSLLGFDAFIVLDNGSTDATADIVRQASKHFPIHCWQWDRSGPDTQTGAYKQVCRTFVAEFDWIGFIDADEFLVLHRHQDAGSFLSGFAGFAGVGVHWAIFGANGHDDFHNGLLIESFTRRSAADFFPNRHVRSFVRPGAVIACPNPHFFQVRGGYCSPAGAPIEWLHKIDGVDYPGGITAGPADYSLCQLNHYFTRSRASWAEKLRRGYSWRPDKRRDEEFDYYDRNEVEDRSACARAASVRRRMAEFGPA